MDKQLKTGYTKEQIKTLIRMWNSHSIPEITKELGLTAHRISFLANCIRKAGYDLPKKSVMPKNSLKHILEEIKAERGVSND